MFRRALFAIGCAIGLFFIVEGSGSGYIRTLIMGDPASSLPMLEEFMWFVFFFGFWELIYRAGQARRERDECQKKLLPEDKETVLTLAELPEVYRAIDKQEKNLFLPRLIKRVILQFQSSHAIDNANSLLTSSVELYMHEVELRYSFLRYIMWLIPTLGFIGTILGITDALNYAGSGDYNDVSFLPEITARLGTAFYTTLLALLQAAGLVFMLHVVQAKEESALNLSAQYCLDNLINRLYVRR